MKKFSITLIAVLMIVVLCIVSTTVFYAETIFTADGFSYTLLNDNFISIYDWDGGSDDLIIPNKLDRYNVREIRDKCFLNRDDFTALDLLQADYLNRIGISAFKGSTVAGELSIPPQVKTVASGAFENCDHIEVLYYNAMSDLISSQCFYDCDALSEVYITDGITTIERHAFSSCDSLTIVRLPETITSIDATAFSNSPNVVIYCYTDSYAHQYAVEKGIDFVLIDAPEPTEPPTEPETVAPTEAPTEEPTDAPTEPVTEEPTAKSGYLLGDINDDEDVNTVDATIILRYCADIKIPVTMQQLMHGDVDDDTDVSVIDATFILRYSADIPTPYPIGELVYLDT